MNLPTFDSLMQIFLRLKSLLDQYDTTEKNLADLEMQQEILSRMGGESEDVKNAKSMTWSGIKTLTSQKEASRRTIEDFTALQVHQLRERVAEIGVRIEQLSAQAIEEKKLRAGFEILIETNSFAEDEGETRADFEEKLSYSRKVTEAMHFSVSKLIEKSLNKKSIVVPTDSVLKKLWNEKAQSNPVTAGSIITGTL